MLLRQVKDILSSVPDGVCRVERYIHGDAAGCRGGRLGTRANPDYGAADVVGHIISKSEGINGPVPKRIDVAAALGIPIVGEYRCTGTARAITADNLVVPPGAIL